MTDFLLKETQEWLNATYAGRTGFNRVPEDGVTRAATYHGLIRAIQIELGLGSYSNTFGPGTTAAFRNLSLQTEVVEPSNMIYILQGGFWTKGYNPGGFTGQFDRLTELAVKRFQRDIGISESGIVTAEVMKALLNTDGYGLSSSQGSNAMRGIQQFLNATYGGRYFSYVPTNGVYERKTNQALIYGLQAEMGMSTSVANGNFGPGTTNGCPVLFEGDTGNNVTILQGALIGNGYNSVGLTAGQFDTSLRNIVLEFQRDLTLPPTGIADMPTIKQLLTSNGDTGRTATVCDTATILNTSNIQTIKNNGFDTVGRYLTGTVGGTRSKALTSEELKLMFMYGLKVFPIYQDGGWYSDYFSEVQGTYDAKLAVSAANALGFAPGTTIYFAVDFDAYDFEVRDKILPYFRGIKNELLNLTQYGGVPNYKVGIYGPRNSCIQVQNANLAEHSFVSNMSTGFSGNLGFPMPENWSFNQFFEMQIYSGTHESLPIDKVDTSGRDPGVSSVNPPSVDEIIRQAWAEVGSKIPFVNTTQFLFSAEFEFERSFNLIDTGGMSLDLLVSKVVTLGEGNNTVSVNNGQIDFSVAAQAEEIESSVSLSDLGSAQNFLDGLAVGMGNGLITVEVKQVPDGMELKMIGSKLDLPVPPGTEVGLQVALTLTLRNFTPVDYREVTKQIGLYVLAPVALFGLAVATPGLITGATAVGGYAAVATATSAILVFLGIKKEDENES